jgi:hypothetical protein
MQWIASNRSPNSDTVYEDGARPGLEDESYSALIFRVCLHVLIVSWLRGAMASGPLHEARFILGGDGGSW